MPRKKFSTINEYIKSWPEPLQGILKKIKDTVHKSALKATEAMSWDIPTFKLNGNWCILPHICII